MRGFAIIVCAMACCTFADTPRCDDDATAIFQGGQWSCVHEMPSTSPPGETTPVPAWTDCKHLTLVHPDASLRLFVGAVNREWTLADPEEAGWTAKCWALGGGGTVEIAIEECDGTGANCQVALELSCLADGTESPAAHTFAKGATIFVDVVDGGGTPSQQLGLTLCGTY